jgi:Na+/glutamate symporter
VLKLEKLLSTSKFKLAFIVCAIIGAMVISTIALRIIIVLISSPLFWMIVIVGIVIKLILKEKGDK